MLECRHPRHLCFSFSIALHCGAETAIPKAVIGFIASVFVENDGTTRLELNSYLDSHWGQPVTSQHLKLRRGDDIQLKIINHLDGFEAGCG